MARPKAAIVHNKRKRKSSRCYLLELPPELRLEIYDYLFIEKYEVLLTVDRDCEMQTCLRNPESGSAVPKKEARKLSALLKTCKTLATEVTPVLSQNLHFHIHLSPDMGSNLSPQKKLRKLHQCQFAKHIRMMSISVTAPDHAAAASAGERLRMLTKVLQPDRTIKLDTLRLYFSTVDMMGAADPILKALMAINCKKGFKLYYSSSKFDSGGPDMATWLCWRAFEKWSGVIRDTEMATACCTTEMVEAWAIWLHGRMCLSSGNVNRAFFQILIRARDQSANLDKPTLESSTLAVATESFGGKTWVPKNEICGLLDSAAHMPRQQIIP
ncbi:hypothetical protein LTR27_000501 [Elasticomyces elasticus]|nr:hypothetical protein LTR27_000501 [Elasticomyces elasticus]